MTIRYEGGKQLRFYEYFIDFTPDKIDINGIMPCIRGNIMTFIPKSEFGTFSNEILKRKIIDTFHMKMIPLKTGKLCLVCLQARCRGFDHIPFTPEKIKQGLLSLLELLNIDRRMIVWKEDGMGYLINKDGCISKSWLLNKNYETK